MEFVLNNHMLQEFEQIRGGDILPRKDDCVVVRLERRGPVVSEKTVTKVIGTDVFFDEMGHDTMRIVDFQRGMIRGLVSLKVPNGKQKES